MSAKKFDKEKSRYELLPPTGLRMAADAMTVGAKKYGDHNYLEGEGLDPERMLGAAYRHLEAIKEALLFDSGSVIDADSGVHHAGCAIAEIMMLVEVLERRDVDYHTEGSDQLELFGYWDTLCWEKF